MCHDLEYLVGKLSQTFQSSPRKGIFWMVAGVIMLVGAIWVPWFTLDLWEVRFPIGVLALVFGVLNFILWYGDKKRIELTGQELATYGPVLEELTPHLLDSIREGQSVKLISSRIEEEKGIPKAVTLKYIIAVGKEIQRLQQRGDDQ